MSFLEGPKSRSRIFAPALNPPLNGTPVVRPGCVQCGSLLEIADCKNTSFSGKCVSCEYWVADEGEQEIDDLEY